MQVDLTDPPRVRFIVFKAWLLGHGYRYPSSDVILRRCTDYQYGNVGVTVGFLDDEMTIAPLRMFDFNK